MLKDVKIKSVKPVKEPKYIKPMLVEYERDGKTLTWEMVKSHDSVHIMVDNIETEELMFVKQVRIPVLMNNPDTNGEVIECCAGLVDKDKSIEQIAKEEVYEEMGYDIPVENFLSVRKMMSSVGTKGSRTECFTVQVDESMKTSSSGGLEDEDIEIVRVPYKDALEFAYGKGKYEEIMTDSTTIFMILDWFATR